MGSSRFPGLIIALLGLWGCVSTVELVSRTEVEEKISRVRIGQSDREEIQRLFGAPLPGSDADRWNYHFADKQFEISERRQGPAVGAVPFTAGVVPTNTRAVVSFNFNSAGVVKRLEAARFFEEPFINDYWFWINEPAREPLESLAKIGESVGFKASRLDKAAGVLNLDDPNSEAKIFVQIDGPILRVTSTNPHQRLATEYRVYTKRENAFTKLIASSDLVQ
ncbi:MAG TPA: hypothetical protein VNO43_05370 [Candidatus Eisenbacteria bacterium]|jgi:hypothetical protein|nr:hypothetical protein [Candidatus Eisenbacteria bacterium]